MRRQNVSGGNEDYEPLLDNEDEVVHRPTNPKRCSCLCAGCIIALSLVAASAVVLVILILQVGLFSPKVQTDCGTIKGTYDRKTGVAVFKGVPYAEPPVSKLRWRPPKSMDMKKGNCWVGEYEATQFRDQCAQVEPYKQQFVGTEDCLYLNIYTPKLSTSAGLPVMVYLHGGYMMFLNGSLPGYSPSPQNAKDHNVVYVSVEFRIGAMGFLVVDPVDDQTGNYGLWDQLEALKWIQRNIQHFGGDPNQVTVFGQSSGGTSVFALMASPHAQGLFQRAWSLSGSPNFPSTLQEAAVKNNAFKDLYDCDDIHCLRKKAIVQDVVELANKRWPIDDLTNLPTKKEDIYSLTVIDGDLLPKSPLASWQSQGKAVVDVPLLIGVTAQEIDYLPLPLMGKILTWNKTDYEAYTTQRLQSFGSNVSETALNYYPFTPDPELAWSTMVSDVRVICANQVLAKAAAQHLQSPVYLYVVTSRPAHPIHVFDLPWAAKYATHNWDLLAFWGHMGKWMRNGEPSQENQNFAQLMQDNVLAFVRSGRVADSKWKSADVGTATLNESVVLLGEYHPDRCKFWMQQVSFNYSWVN